jgi:hypothetical protein
MQSLLRITDLGAFGKAVGDHAFWPFTLFQNRAFSSSVKKHVLRQKKKFIPCFLLLTKCQNNKLLFHSMLFGVITGCQTGT